MSRIVVVDGYTVSPESTDRPPSLDRDAVSWNAIARLGALEVYPRTDRSGRVERIGDAPYVLTNKVPLDAGTIENLPALRYIGVTATGTNIVDLEAATAAGITVTNVPGYSSVPVAQHTIGLLLSLAGQIGRHDEAVHDGQWASCHDFCFTVAPLVELDGLTLGIIGLGDIGTRVARLAIALGMKVIVHSRTKKEVGLDVRWVGMDELLAQSDVLSLHCPLTEQTDKLINDKSLRQMKQSAFLLNTSRGGLVDEAALSDALHDGRIAGAALDVLSTEPPASDNPMLSAPHCILTPHLAWATVASRRRLIKIAAENLERFIAGDPVNVVNPQVLTP